MTGKFLFLLCSPYANIPYTDEKISSVKGGGRGVIKIPNEPHFKYPPVNMLFWVLLGFRIFLIIALFSLLN